MPDGEDSLYIGESSRNLYTRSQEHVSIYRGGKITSFIGKHQSKEHQGEEASYRAKVTTSTFFHEYANANLSSNVTLVFDDTHQLCAHKGRNY